LKDDFTILKVNFSAPAQTSPDNPAGANALAGKQSGGQKLEGSLREGKFLPACRSEAPPPCSFRAESRKKAFFSF